MTKIVPSPSTARAVSGLDRKVGEKLRLLRQAEGLSQNALAERVGITYQQLQKYERGVNRISAARLVELATALETPVLTFFESTPPANRQRVRASSDQIEEVKDLFSQIRNSRIRRRIMVLMKLLAGGKRVEIM